jgi:hypothetical protein
MSKRRFKIVNDKLIVQEAANPLTDAIITYLNLQGHFVWRQNNTGIWDPIKKIFRKNAKQKKGIPDICGFTKNGYGLYVEVKTTDKLSPEQQVFGEEATKRGAVWIVARTLEDVTSCSI